MQNTVPIIAELQAYMEYLYSTLAMNRPKKKTWKANVKTCIYTRCTIIPACAIHRHMYVV